MVFGIRARIKTVRFVKLAVYCETKLDVQALL